MTDYPKKRHHKSPPLPPPPTPSELAFQQYQFDERIGGSDIAPKFKLGAAFFSTHGKDMTIRGQIMDRLRKAGKVLLLAGLDKDS